MADRQAPDCGYDVGVKRQYRRNVWRALAYELADKPLKTVVLMPSLEGDEIDVALGHGFNPTRLHVVDKNAAIVATLKRRYPRINTHGVSLIRALERLSNNNQTRIDVANLDLCGQIGKELLETLWRASMSQLWAASARVAVTVMRGRESSTGLIEETAVGAEFGRGSANLRMLHDAWRPRHISPDYPLTERDAFRLACIASVLTGNISKGLNSYRARFMHSGTYVSGRVSMLWGVFELKSKVDGWTLEELTRIGLFPNEEPCTVVTGG